MGKTCFGRVEIWVKKYQLHRLRNECKWCHMCVCSPFQVKKTHLKFVNWLNNLHPCVRQKKFDLQNLCQDCIKPCKGLVSRVTCHLSPVPCYCHPIGPTLLSPQVYSELHPIRPGSVVIMHCLLSAGGQCEEQCTMH